MGRSILLLGAWLAGSQVAALGDLPTITPAPVLGGVLNAAATDPGFSACATASNVVVSCSSVLESAGAHEATGSQWHKCLCCSGTTWSPNMFDDSVESCADYIKTDLPGHTSEYSAYSALGNYCHRAGNICTGTAAATRTQSASDSIITTQAAGCSSLLEIVSECASLDSGILTEPVETRALCYCYMTDSQNVSTTWVPQTFDGYASECADWASTADKSLYPSLLELATFCHSVGNFATTTEDGSSSSITTTRGRSSSSTTTSTTAGTGQHSEQITSSPTAVTVTVNPASTSASANAAAVSHGQGSAVVGFTSVAIALFSYFL
ncbi:hypothetical protein TruAng_002729 [Truncatella angustata]|nr:hypothetical protein TruAng_002729 [Truncatella angustata]